MDEWDTYLLGMAQHAATKSKDETKVGAVLVAPDNRTTLLTGYNGIPKNVQDLEERIRIRPEKYFWVSHAENNLIAHAARRGIATNECIVYVTHFPCSECAKTLIQAGIKKVVFGNGKTSMDSVQFAVARKMFEEARVVCETVL